MANIKQYHDISFPLSRQNTDGFFLDLNKDNVERLVSDIAHVILTPKKTKIRRPDFGTDLIKFVFGQNDETTWDEIVEEARTSVSRYVPNASLVNMSLLRKEENDNELFLKLVYTVKKGNSEENRVTAIRIQ